MYTELKIGCIIGGNDKTPIVFLLFTFPVKFSLVSGDYRIRLLVPYAVSGGYNSRVWRCMQHRPRYKVASFFFFLVTVIGGKLSIYEGLNSPW